MEGPPRLVDGGARPSGGAEAVRGRLKPRDPFELIRWLAFSQTDPRKALAELVQNSLDAGARTVRVGRFRERGLPCLRVWDDGAGVIPDTDRTAALRAIATSIGHSRKRSLSPQQRFELMTQGQYGIGLLGFWSLGERLEMRSAVPGQMPHRLILHRDRPQYRVEPLGGRLGLDERWTEVVVLGLFREAQRALTARRASDYLATELRGQLLERDVELVVEDRTKRTDAPMLFDVRPPRFLGERIGGLRRLEVPGYPSARLELYVVGDDESAPPLALHAAGTAVVERFDDLEALGLARPPWTDRRLTGVIDFPALRVAPGSRRGVAIDDAARGFAAALLSIATLAQGALDAAERRRDDELERSMVRHLQRAFRDFFRERPRFAPLAVRERHDDVDTDGGDRSVPSLRRPTGRTGDLLPPGPLATLRVRPAVVTVATGGIGTVRATALDAVGRELDRAAGLTWRVVGRGATVRPCEETPDTARVEAGEWPGSATLLVEGTCDGRTARGEARIEIARSLRPGRADDGLPAPELVELPAEPWRSRVVDGRWEVNAGHRDYVEVAERPSLKLRYLSLLFAKDVVGSDSDEGLSAALEQMVEIAAFADRRLARRRTKR